MGSKDEIGGGGGRARTRDTEQKERDVTTSHTSGHTRSAQAQALTLWADPAPVRVSDGLQPHSRLRLCPHAGFAVELRVKTAQVWGKADSACAQHAPGPVGRNHGHEPTRGQRRKKIASNGQRSESHKTDGHADRRRHAPQSPGGCARIRLSEDVCDSHTPSQRQMQSCAKTVSPKVKGPVPVQFTLNQ